ncbi:MAG: TIGR01777 family oxidoreductase [Methylococcaceae bacterium]|nr:TIGR01777 family oxidoreductase [Prolixibacteraceae bacterium]
MNIAIAGANGFIARNLISELAADHHTIVPIKRPLLSNPEKLAVILADTDVVINLSGAPILQRWTDSHKKEILDSRVETTANIVKAINSLPDQSKPRTFISASAIGIYTPGMMHTDESRSYSDDFVGEVVKQWEKASNGLSPKVRRVVFRIGLILGKESQTMQRLLPVFKLGLGGKIGSGKQPFPFVHIFDVVNAIVWGIQHERASGIYNLVAPDDIDNNTFTSVLARSLNRPAIFTVPSFSLKLAYGEASSLLLTSPRVTPQRLLNEGFVFLFPDIQSCIAEIIA